MKNITLGIVLIGMFAWQRAQYIECKKEGFSTFYCIQHAG